MSQRVTLEVSQIRQMLMTAGELGAQNMARELGLAPKDISISEAYKRAGSRRIVDGWIREGILTPIKQGKRSVRIDVAEFEAARKTNMLYSKHLREVG